MCKEKPQGEAWDGIGMGQSEEARGAACLLFWQLINLSRVPKINQEQGNEEREK
jgi:hypothetical protein